MDSKVAAIAGAGLLITIALAFISIYLAGIAFILLVTLIMSLLIMQDSTFHPQLAAELGADARAVILRNTGNAPAMKIHAALIPLNIEFDIPSLAPDTTYEHPLAAMVENVKVSVTYENEKGGSFSRSFTLNAFEQPYDPLRPMIPLFKWK